MKIKLNYYGNEPCSKAIKRRFNSIGNRDLKDMLGILEQDGVKKDKVF